jgi:hypothetical protein
MSRAAGEAMTTCHQAPFDDLDRDRVAGLGSGYPSPDFPHKAFVRQNLQSFLEPLDVVQADNHRHGASVARDRHAILFTLYAIDDFRKLGLRQGERNCLHRPEL